MEGAQSLLRPEQSFHGRTPRAPWKHASTRNQCYLATVETIFGLPKLGATATANVMTEFFH